MSTNFNHFDSKGNAIMVDVSNKDETTRIAIAKSSIRTNKEVYEQIINHQNKKGDVLGVARVAGIMATKQTSQLIPMCHPIAISNVEIDMQWRDSESEEHILDISVKVKTKSNTGVEMEALTGASTSALTIYDMCKAVDKGMVIGDTFLDYKSGGKSGDYQRNS
nr:cyclic pyranopterin monophosphate synthase MoaC [Alkalibacillus aidingensis]